MISTELTGRASSSVCATVQIPLLTASGAPKTSQPPPDLTGMTTLPPEKDGKYKVSFPHPCVPCVCMYLCMCVCGK
jgi:hypothetical protein